MSESQLTTAPVTPGFHKATSALSATLGIEPRMMIDTLKRQCFLGQNADAVSDAQLAAFISVANDLDLNPLLPGMLYAYPGKNGAMIPVTGPDGIFKMLDKRIGAGVLDGYECTVFPEDMTQKPTHATATIWRKGSDHPSKYTALLSEWNVSSNPNWGSRPRHMLWIRALKQCARQVIHGIPMDEDEVTISDMRNVTPEGDSQKIDRPAPPERKPRGATSVTSAEVVVEKEAAPAAPEPTSVPPGTPPAGPGDEANAPTTPAPAAAGAMPRFSLKEGEKFSGIITVTDSGGFIWATAPAVKALTEGDYKGTVYCKNVGTIADGKVAVPALWAVGSRLKVALVGTLNMKARHPATKDAAGNKVLGALIEGGQLQTLVESAEPVPADGADEEMGG